MKRIFILVLSSLALFATAIASEPVSLTDDQVALVHEAVKARLKDPQSAQFGIHKAASGGVKVVDVCGWVNAKNGYGGYTGDMPYYAIMIQSESVVVMAVGGDDNYVSATLKRCARMGAALSEDER